MCGWGKRNREQARIYKLFILTNYVPTKDKNQTYSLERSTHTKFLGNPSDFYLDVRGSAKVSSFILRETTKRLTVQDFTAIHPVAVEIFLSSGEQAEWLSGLQCHRWSHNGNMATDKLSKGILEYSYAEQICKFTASTIGEWQAGTFCGQSTTWLRCELWIDMFVSVQWQ